MNHGVKIDIRQIPPEGLNLTEELSPLTLDLETDIIKFDGPVSLKAQISRITNAVSAHLSLNALMRLSCSRCLNDFEIELNKGIDLNYPVDESMLYIDLEPDIREEIIIGYPIKPLCKADCKGLCPQCGENLNDSECNCQVKSKK